jgi:hypothetical protein
MGAFLTGADTRLLLDCVSPAPSVDRLRAHAGRVRDWPGFLRRATGLGVTPLVYWRLKDVRGAAVPEGMIAEFRRHFQAHAVASVRRTHRLGQLLAAFDRAHVPVIALKGAVLAELVYPHAATRPMGDLDLMVASTDLDAADPVMRGLGYLPDPSVPRSPEWYRSSHLHLVPYVLPDSSPPVEVHHHIIRSPHAERVPIEDLWRRARPARLASCETLVLSPEDLLFHLALHAVLTDRVLGRLRGLTDIAFTIQRYQDRVDWDALIRQARDSGTARHVHAAFWLARDLVSADAPDTVLRLLRSGSGRSAIEDRLFRVVGRRAAVADDPARSVLPPWLVRELCDALLQGRGAIRSAIAFGRVVGAGYVRSARIRGARSRLLTPVYVGLVHPVSLLASAARRARGRPEAPPAA